MLRYVYSKKAIDLARNVRFWYEFATECGIDKDPFDLRILFWKHIVVNPEKYVYLTKEELEYFGRLNYVMDAPLKLTEIRENADIIALRCLQLPVHTRVVVDSKRFLNLILN